MATFYTGASGVGSGPHLDFRVFDVGSGAYVNPGNFTDIMQVGGKPLTEQFTMTSGYGPRNISVPGASKDHKGMDYATPEGTEVTITGGKHLSTFSGPRGGVMSQYAFQRDGKNYEALLLHGSDQNTITGEAAVTDYDPKTIFGEGAVAPATTPGGSADAPEKAQKFLKEKIEIVKNTPKDVVERFGNDFGDMKSDRLGSALAGAQENIIQSRMDAGENFGTKQKKVK